MQKVIYFILSVAIIVSCQNQNKEVATSAAPAVKAMIDSFAGLKKLHFDYAKDPSCGMPLSVEIEDTTSYKGKLYGFCSKDCKEIFLKDPVAYVPKTK